MWIVDINLATQAVFVLCSAIQPLGAKMAGQEEFKVTIKGPGLSFDQPIDKAAANRIMSFLMTGSALPDAGGQGGGTGAATGGLGANRSGLNPKQFIASKKPRTQYERVACIADYLTNVRNTPQFDTDAIAALNTEAAQAPIKNIGVIVRDTAHKYGYLSAAGNGNNKQITVLGEAVASALPDRDAVKAAIAENRPSRKRKRVARKKK